MKSSGPTVFHRPGTHADEALANPGMLGRNAGVATGGTNEHVAAIDHLDDRRPALLAAAAALAPVVRGP